MGVPLVAAVNGRRLARAVARDGRRMLSAASEGPRIGRLDALPVPVRRYLDRALAGRERAVRTAWLRHQGTMRTRPDGPWLPIRGEQYFSADPPGFLWWGRARMLPGLWVDAVDRCVDGVGRMHVRAESTLTLADSTGPEIDQGALLRLLGEMVWFPTAFQDGRYVTWAAVDGRRAQATLRVAGRSAFATFAFGDDGLPSRMLADRYRDLGGGRSTLTPWSGEYGDYRVVEGLLVPHEVVASWLVEGQWVPVIRFRVERLECDAAPPS